MGQKQRWYLLNFIGDDSAVNINTPEPEFSEWKWVNSQDLINLIVNFKKPLYQQIVDEFKDYLQ